MKIRFSSVGKNNKYSISMIRSSEKSRWKIESLAEFAVK